MHQSNESFLNVTNLHRAFRKLMLHPGVPSAEGLLCPIFTQNKMNYLIAVPDICPTFFYDYALNHKVEQDSEEFILHDEGALSMFCSQYNEGFTYL